MLHSGSSPWILIFSLWLAAGVPAAAADATLPEALAGQFENRTPLLGAEEPDRIKTALDAAVTFPPQQVEQAAEEFVKVRKAQLRSAAGKRPSDYVLYFDVLRYPESYSGRPVRFDGVLQGEIGGAESAEGFRLLKVVPVSAPEGTVVIAVSQSADVPAMKSRVHVAGFFLKLAELPSATNANTGTAPQKGDPAETGGGTESRTKTETAPLVVAVQVAESELGTSPEVDAQRLSVVQDRTLGIRPAERELYYEFLAKAKHADQATLRDQAAGLVAQRRKAGVTYAEKQRFPIFIDVFKHPNLYRGKPVTVRGYARRIVSYPADTNAGGIGTLYEAWVFTDDSQTNPFVIVASEVSPDIPLGEDVQVSVRATGYFLKLYAYRAHDQGRLAPMILAGELRHLPEPEPELPTFWFGLGILAFAGVVVLWASRSWLRERRARQLRSTESGPDFSEFIEPPEPREGA